jgi:signal transduction histidine kinase/ActR/RegA family two-component response regulator
MEHTENTQSTEMLDEIDQIIYIADMDTYELLFLNRLGKIALGCGEEYRGKKCFEILQGRNEICPFCKNDCLNENGGTCSWDHYNDKIGAYYQLQDRQICYKGHRARMEMAIDISGREERQTELKNALTELSMLSGCVRILNGNTGIDKRIDQVLDNIGNYYHADRAYIFRISEDGLTASNTFEWCKTGVLPEIEFLQNMDIHYMDRWKPAFLRNEAIIEPDIEHIRNAYPGEYGIMIRQGIHSYMEAPLFTEGSLAGFLGLDNPDSSIIGNSSAPLLTMAYSVSNALTRDVNQRKKQDHYERSLHEMMTAVPNAVGILRFNLTKNTCVTDTQEHSFFGIEEKFETWDNLVQRLSERIYDPEEQRQFQSFHSSNLYELFRQGTTHYQMSYRYAGTDGNTHFVLTQLTMIENPDTQEVEGVAYSLNQTMQVRQNEIFRIITDRSFDLVALIHLKESVFEAVFLGESLPEEYRVLLPKRGAQCSFQAFCAESVRHMDDKAKADYESRLSPEYMRKALDLGGGSYEFILKESFPGRKHDIMYRKFLHYRLDSDPDAVLVIESDETEAVLRQQEELKRMQDAAEHDLLIMDSLMGGIAVLKMEDKEHLTVEYCNSYIFQMLGYDSTDIPKRREDAKGTLFEPLFSNALTFIHPDDKERVMNAFLKNYDGDSFALKPYRMFGKDNACYWILERVRTGVAADGKRIFYATFHDVTDQIELQSKVTRQLEVEKQLREKADHANTAKTDFLSRISHDMRTPLNGIIGMAYLAQEQENPPYTADCLSKINTSAKFLLALINNILDMSKVESGKTELHPEPYTIEEFNSYLDAVIRPLCKEKNQNFELYEDIDMARVPLCDKNCVNQIVFNLLSNSVKFTPEGGRITYRLYVKKLDQNRVTIEHRISDTGIGITSEFQEHLFEPFSQEGRNDVSEHRGSGLGLSIVKKLVDLMGGTISVQSEVGHGTTFLMDLEFDTVALRQEAQANEFSETESIGTHFLFGKHVLLCEDHPLNQEIAKSLLEEKGAVVDIVENGELGVKRFSVSAINYYDAILMDIRMPVMDGYKTTKFIRALDRPDAKTVPIIAMTADAFDESVQAARQAGMNGYVTKPVEPDKLYNALSEQVKK